MALTSGYIYVERGTGNAMQLACEGFELSIRNQLQKQDLAGDNRVGFSVQIISRTLILKNTWFSSKTDLETFLDTANTLNDAGTSTIEIRVETSAQPASNLDIKSGVSSMEMLFENIEGIEQMEHGGGAIFRIKKISLVQAG